MNNFSNQLHRLRKEKNLTQKNLGEIIGVSDKQISKWEKGELLPNIENVQKLAEFFGVSFQEILTGEKLKEKIILPKRLRCSIVSIIIELVCCILLVSCFVMLVDYDGKIINLYSFSGEFIKQHHLVNEWIVFYVAIAFYLICFVMYIIKFKIRVLYGKPLQVVMVENYISDDFVIKKCYSLLCVFICLTKLVFIVNFSISIILTILGYYRSSIFVVIQSSIFIMLILSLYFVCVYVFWNILKRYMPVKL